MSIIKFFENIISIPLIDQVNLNKSPCIADYRFFSHLIINYSRATLKHKFR